jgi:hypothetical protein
VNGETNVPPGLSLLKVPVTIQLQVESGSLGEEKVQVFGSYGM